MPYGRKTKAKATSLATCLANDCNAKLRRGRHACFIHWQALDANLQRRLTSARSQSELGSLRIEAAEYLEGRKKGRHLVTHCRSCGGDIIFLPAKTGKQVPIDADQVDVDDNGYDHRKHPRHMSTCPTKDDKGRP